MIPLVAASRSSLGKKYLMGFTGLVWFGFVIGHLIGNYLLLVGRDAFDGYGYFLETMGHHALLYVVEVFLLVVLATHVLNGFQVALLDKGKARKTRYAVTGNAGGKSRKTIASKNMIWTGIILLLFLIFHIATMKFGVFSDMSTYKLQDGPEVRDLYKRVVEWFSKPGVVIGYVLVMAMLSAHLSHGIWSAFQSLGLLERGYYKFALSFSRIFAVILGVGFMVLPIVIFLMNDKFSQAAGGLFQ
jgi:succinate dehydrogenase / fumarate reductase cytochrome b subunit